MNFLYRYKQRKQIIGETIQIITIINQKGRAGKNYYQMIKKLLQIISSKSNVSKGVKNNRIGKCQLGGIK